MLDDRDPLSHMKMILQAYEIRENGFKKVIEEFQEKLEKAKVVTETYREFLKRYEGK